MIIRFYSRAQAIGFAIALSVAVVAVSVYALVLPAMERRRLREEWQNTDPLPSALSVLRNRRITVTSDCDRHRRTMFSGVFPLGLRSVEPVPAPADRARLTGVRFQLEGDDGTTAVLPEGEPFGKGDICEPVAPRDIDQLERDAERGAIRVEERADAAKKIEKYADRLFASGPDIKGLGWLSCAKKTCTAVYAWAEGTKPLWVIRVETPRKGDTPKDDREAAQRLAQLAAVEAAKP